MMNCRRTASLSGVPQGSIGPTPMRKSTAMPPGTAILLKYGSPTLTRTPRTASEMSG